MKPSAAGVLFVHDGKALFMKRAGDPHANTWGLPGGGIEDGETPETAARRETREECGFDYAGPLTPLWTTADGFQCFGAALDKAFVPKLNHEHHAARWADFDDLPQPLHPSLAEGVAKMPLVEGKSEKSKSENIAREINAGKDPKQAAAIAYSVQRKAAHANDALPAHVLAAYDALNMHAENCLPAQDRKR
jgi:ADP-ribose pyrophosphatase YjhB (NUDIX family)